MVQHSASPRGEERLAGRISKSPPLGLAGGAVAILVMVLALAGVIPRGMFFIAAAGLVVIAYKLDRRFKTAAPSAPPLPAVGVTPPAAPAAPSAPGAPGAPPAFDMQVSPPQPSPAQQPPPVPAGDLQAEHARLTRELTERVDDDEDVRFEKFMRLRAIETELSRQTPQPPS
jgi:hypothetical protein